MVDLVEKEKPLEEDDDAPPVAVPEPRCTRTHIVCELALGFLILAIAVNPPFLTKNTIRSLFPLFLYIITFFQDLWLSHNVCHHPLPCPAVHFFPL